MTDYGGGIHLVKAAFPFSGRDEDEVKLIHMHSILFEENKHIFDCYVFTKFVFCNF